MEVKKSSILSSMDLIVIAGNRQQYEQFLSEHQFPPEEARYVYREEQLFGLHNVEIVKTGDWRENPVADSNQLRILERSGTNRSFDEPIRNRHSLLVDKKFLEGLTEIETNELTQINHLLDALEEKYYAPIKDVLATVRASFLEERNSNS